MKSILSGLAFSASLMLGAATAFAAPTDLPALDPGTELWQSAPSSIHLAPDFAAQVAAREASSGLKFRVVVTEQGDDLGSSDRLRWAPEILHNRLWDQWRQAGGFDTNGTVVLLFIAEKGTGKGSTGVRVGQRLNDLGINPNFLSDANGPIKPVMQKYDPDHADEALLKVIDNITETVRTRSVVSSAAGNWHSGESGLPMSPLGIFALCVAVVFSISLLWLLLSSEDGAPPPSSRTNRPEKRGSQKSDGSGGDGGPVAVPVGGGGTCKGGGGCSGGGGGGCSGGCGGGGCGGG